MTYKHAMGQLIVLLHGYWCIRDLYCVLWCLHCCSCFHIAVQLITTSAGVTLQVSELFGRRLLSGTFSHLNTRCQNIIIMSTILQQRSRNSWLQIPETVVVYTDRVSLGIQADPVQLLILYNTIHITFLVTFLKGHNLQALCTHRTSQAADP